MKGKITMDEKALFNRIKDMACKGTPCSNEDIQAAAKALNIEPEEILVMLDRVSGMNGSPMFKSLKSGGGLSKVASTLKAGGGKFKVTSSGEVHAMKPPATEDTHENEIPTVVEQAAKLLGVPAQQLFDMMQDKSMVRTKAEATTIPALPLSPFASQRLNAKLHPALADLPAEAFKADDEADTGPTPYDLFTSALLNPQLAEQLKELSTDQQANIYDQFTSNRLNPQRQSALQTRLKQAQAGASSVAAAMAQKDAARLAAWQAEQASKDEQARHTHGRTRRLNGFYEAKGW
jgi:hypothetical protein